MFQKLLVTRDAQFRGTLEKNKIRKTRKLYNSEKLASSFYYKFKFCKRYAVFRRWIEKPIKFFTSILKTQERCAYIK